MDASVNRISSSIDEKAFIIGIKMKGADPEPVQYSLDELEMLVRTAGAFVAEKRIITREKIDPAYIIGKGFIEEMIALIDEKKIRLIVFDLNNIRPAPVRNLEERLKCRVVGRTEIIMDIFAMRARSAEAKIQVELAQLKYILPRLKGLGGVLSRLGGGIGTRGPGEKMLETDRRHVLHRITLLSKKLEGIKKHRAMARKGRRGEFILAVVGYTNAGKSTLINKFARDDLFVEDRLFATLDSYTRKAYLGNGKMVLLTDTVGFIRNLPANLIDSFRSTLEEIKFADAILHVVDISAPDIESNLNTVNSEISRLGCSDKPVIMFFNKTDLVPDNGVGRIPAFYSGSLSGSILSGNGIEELKIRIFELSEKVQSA